MQCCFPTPCPPFNVTPAASEFACGWDGSATLEQHTAYMQAAVPWLEVSGKLGVHTHCPSYALHKCSTQQPSPYTHAYAHLHAWYRSVPARRPRRGSHGTAGWTRVARCSRAYSPSRRSSRWTATAWAPSHLWASCTHSWAQLIRPRPPPPRRSRQPRPPQQARPPALRKVRWRRLSPPQSQSPPVPAAVPPAVAAHRVRWRQPLRWCSRCLLHVTEW